jgi:hypothetical protein
MRAVGSPLRARRIPGARGDSSRSVHATGQRHALDARVVDDRVHLVVGDEKIGVSAHRRAGLAPKSLKGQGALRHAASVFHHHDIAGHQIGRGKTRELVVGKIPRLDAEENAERTAFDHGLTRLGLELLRREKPFGVFGVVIDDVCANRHFAARLVDAFAHLKRHRAGEFVHTSAQDGRGFCGHGGAPGERSVPPRGVAGRSAAE